MLGRDLALVDREQAKRGRVEDEETKWSPVPERGLKSPRPVLDWSGGAYEQNLSAVRRMWAQ